MRLFILKTIIITLAAYILFQATIGYQIDNYSKKIKSFSNQYERDKIKKKLIEEINKGNSKDYIFSIEDREILSKFINKIFTELKIFQNKNN
jgi:hypothetical protein